MRAGGGMQGSRSVSAQPGGNRTPVTKRIAAVFICYAAVAALSATLTACEDDNMTNAINDIKRENEAQLMALPGVVSVGVGQAPDGRPAIIVGLGSDDPTIARQVPDQIRGYPVITQRIGTIKAR